MTASIGEAFADQKINLVTINIPSSRLHEDSNKTRRQHMLELFGSIGGECQKTFLNATTRSDVFRDNLKVVKLTDGYIGQDLNRSIDPDGVNRVWDWLFEDTKRVEKLHNGSEALDVPQNILGCSDTDYKKVDQNRLNKGLSDWLRSKEGRAACLFSHRRALEEGKRQYDKKEIKAVLITEDDIQFLMDPERFVEIFGKAMKDLEKQGQWDILMLGASGYIPKSRKGKPNAEKVPGCDHLVKVNFAYGNFAYLVNGSSIAKVIDLVSNHLENNSKSETTIYAQDVVLAKAMEEGKIKVFSIQPKLVGCVPCHSILCEKEMDYTDVLEKEWVLSAEQD